jgi:enoyl-CoA hydratase/carnithine racemase
MDFEQIRAELDDRVLTITLNRPERLNAWTPVMMRELIEAFDRADADDDVRVIVITRAAARRSTGASASAPIRTRCHGTAVAGSRCVYSNAASR